MPALLFPWSRRHTIAIWRARVARRVLDLLSALDAANSPDDMRLPTYHFHALKGDRKGDYAVTVRANWRITFGWEDGGAVHVDMEDYHGR